MPWAVASAGIGAIGAGYAAREGREAAREAGERSDQATGEAIRRGERALETTETQLAPFMGQELAASQQLSAQMGLPTMAVTGAGGPGAGNQDWQLFLRDMLADQVAIAKRAGYNVDNGKAQAEGARRAEGFLRQMQSEGKLPEGMALPTYEDMYDQANDMHSQGFDWGNYGRDEAGKPYKGTGPASYENVQRQFEKYGGGELTASLGEAPGAPLEGEVIPAQTAEDILARAGMEGLDPELRDQYMAQVMRSAETDPELAAYLGLTPESARVGAEYQQLPAYMRAMEQGREQVLQSGAGAGRLYSGRRGEEVTRMAHDVEADYYDRAQREHEAMIGRRFGQRGAELGLMGAEVASGRARQSDAYNNYMMALERMAAPATTTNVGQMRQAAATGQGAQLVDAATRAGDYRMSEAATGAAAIADVAGGIMEMGSAFIDRD